MKTTSSRFSLLLLMLALAGGIARAQDDPICSLATSAQNFSSSPYNTYSDNTNYTGGSTTTQVGMNGACNTSHLGMTIYHSYLVTCAVGSKRGGAVVRTYCGTPGVDPVYEKVVDTLYNPNTQAYQHSWFYWIDCDHRSPQMYVDVDYGC
jgi:hypothetical protein